MEKAGEIEAKGMSLIVSAPTVFELYVGITLSSKAEEEKAQVLAVIGSLPFLPLDAESSGAGGRIYAERSSMGSTIDPEDAMIAGVAWVHGERVLTRNLSIFRALRELKWSRTKGNAHTRWIVCQRPP